MDIDHPIGFKIVTSVTECSAAPVPHPCRLRRGSRIMPSKNVISISDRSDDDSDDDAPLDQVVAKNSAAAAASDGDGDSGSEPDWVKTYKVKQVEARSGDESDSASISNSDAGDIYSDDEDQPVLSFMKDADSESASASEATAEPKKKKTKTKGVPNLVPLSLPPKGKIKTSNLLLQLEDEELDLSGDSGAVGRYNAEKSRVDLDLKGVTYSGKCLKSHTLCTVVVSGGEATIQEVFGNFVHLRQTADVRDKEELSGDFDDFDDFDISGDESEGEGKKGGKKGAKGKGKGKAKGEGGGAAAKKKSAAKRASGGAGGAKKKAKA